LLTAAGANRTAIRTLEEFRRILVIYVAVIERFLAEVPTRHSIVIHLSDNTGEIGEDRSRYHIVEILEVGGTSESRGLSLPGTIFFALYITKTSWSAAVERKQIIIHIASVSIEVGTRIVKLDLFKGAGATPSLTVWAFWIGFTRWT
jgi:hypothetical protein